MNPPRALVGLTLAILLASPAMSRAQTSNDVEILVPETTWGFDGKVVVCGMRYTPLSGYRKGSRETEFLKRLKRMEIWFAKSERMNVYAPVYFSVPTRFGTLTMKASRFDG